MKVTKKSILWVSYFAGLPWALLAVAFFLQRSGVRFEPPSLSLPLIRSFSILYTSIVAVFLFARMNWLFDKLKHHRRLKTRSEQISLLSMIGHCAFLMPGLGAFVLYVSGATVVETIIFAVASSALQLLWARFMTASFNRAA